MIVNLNKSLQINLVNQRHEYPLCSDSKDRSVPSNDVSSHPRIAV